jgi:metallo-beta-lactamase family protein
MTRPKITFHGAARTVTGSLHVVQANGKCYFSSAGYTRAAQRRANATAISQSAVAGVGRALSHAHIDHSGNLPTLAPGLRRTDLHFACHGGPLHRC